MDIVKFVNDKVADSSLNLYSLHSDPSLLEGSETIREKNRLLDQRLAALQPHFDESGVTRMGFTIHPKPGMTPIDIKEDMVAVLEAWCNGKCTPLNVKTLDRVPIE